MVTQAATRAPRRATFRERDACVACGGGQQRTVWSGSFDEPSVRGFLEQSFYSGDWMAALGHERFELVCCEDCEQLYHRRVLTPEWLGVLYSEWIDDEQIERFEAAHAAKASARFEFGRQLVKQVLRIHGLVDTGARPLRLLDFGCGDGEFLRAAQLFGLECFGVDMSASRSQRAERGGVQIVSDWDALDAFTGEPMDAAVLFEVLEHVDDPKGLLEGLSSRVRPGGVLVIEVPDCEESGLRPPTEFHAFHDVNPLEHINDFTQATLDALCLRHGFSRIARPVAHVSGRRRALVRTELGRLARQARVQGTNGYYRRR